MTTTAYTKCLNYNNITYTVRLNSLLHMKIVVRNTFLIDDIETWFSTRTTNTVTLITATIDKRTRMVMCSVNQIKSCFLFLSPVNHLTTVPDCRKSSFNDALDTFNLRLYGVGF